MKLIADVRKSNAYARKSNAYARKSNAYARKSNAYTRKSNANMRKLIADASMLKNLRKRDTTNPTGQFSLDELSPQGKGERQSGGPVLYISHLRRPQNSCPALAIEYKAPHKLGRNEVVTGLVSKIRPERDVINKNGEGFAFISKALAAAIVTQLFSYIITVAQVFAFIIQALRAKPPPPSWHDAAVALNTWAIEYDDVLRNIPKSLDTNASGRDESDDDEEDTQPSPTHKKDVTRSTGPDLASEQG
ncbi:hypothetical protein CMUS01_08528 [Colletotrichum musicola]|uniref:Uncharacterized protein n=1 Tax=Colletotrichum musicola TaxID=2175873 RepID=A0A8H6KCJ3_9PEZI|nr:hypothetical protein CMUS01_08528 [Colletotrichum musicola]